MKILYYLLFCLCLIGCKDQYIVKSKISSADVRIVKDRHDSLYLMLPIGYILKFNREKIISGKFKIKLNNNRIIGIPSTDVLIFDEDSAKYFFDINTRNRMYFPKSGYIVSKSYTYPRNKIITILNRLEIDTTKLNSLKSPQDTLKLGSYIAFRKKFPELIDDLNEVPDSIRLRIRYDGTKIKTLRAKINW